MKHHMNSNEQAGRMRPPAAIAIAVWIVLTVTPAQAVTPISGCPANITVPGYYQLTGNLACTVTISSSNVTLALNGFHIDPPSNASNGIDVNTNSFDSCNLGGLRLQSVSIVGPGLVSGGFNGIAICRTDSSQVATGVVIRNSAQYGINAFHNNALRVDSNIIGHASSYGMVLFDCKGCQVSGNDISGSGGPGILADTTGSSVTISSNTVYGNGGDGIQIQDNVAARIYSNSTVGNSNAGIEVFSADDVIFSNLSLGNVTDLIGGNCVGPPGAPVQHWANDTFQTKSGSCVQ